MADVGPEVGSRLPALAVEDVWPGARVGVVFGRLSQKGGVGDFWKVFPVLIDYPELRLTRRDVHSMRTAIATGNALVLLYPSGRKAWV